MTNRLERDPYCGRSPREIPAYNSFDASRYLRVPENAIRNWAFGYSYARGAGSPLAPKRSSQSPTRDSISFHS